MPYASDAQRRKFHELLAQGKISPDVVKEFDQASKGLSLPDRVSKPPAPPKRMAQKKYHRGGL